MNKQTLHKLTIFLLAFFMLAHGQAQTFETIGIIGSATPGGWDSSTPMVQDDQNAHLWTLSEIELLAGEAKFRANNSWDVNWGNTDFPSGTAYQNGANIPVPAGLYSISFNDETGEYNFAAIVTYATVGMIGSATAGGWDSSTPMVQDAENVHLWTLSGVDLLAGELKFRANNSWDVNWGNTDFPSGVAALDGPNIPVPASNYNITFNSLTGEYSLVSTVSYATVGIIGSATPGGWDASTAMQPTENDHHQWNITMLLEAGEAKFRADNAWDVNWGNTDYPNGVAYENGPNVAIANAGYYTVEFNSLTGAYNFIELAPTEYATIGIIGSATANGWSASTPMTQDAVDSHIWTLTGIGLNTGEVKFRANDSWDVNWGALDFPAGTATQGGPNIPVPAASYNISFNDVTGAYTFEEVIVEPIVQLIPEYPTVDQEVRLIYDASKGTSQLQGAAKVYMHSGVVTTGADGQSWEYVVGNWGQDDGIGEMTPVAGETDKWEIILSPSLRNYYNVPTSTNIFRLAMVFRSADGTLTGKSDDNGDIFVDIDPGNFVSILQPVSTDVFFASGTNVLFEANASHTATSLDMYIDSGAGFELISSANNTATINAEYFPAASGPLTLRVEGTINGETVSSERQFNLIARQPNILEELPAGLTQGINYDSTDNTKATLVLLAPGKEFVTIVGDFTDWMLNSAYQMKQTPDGEIFWLEISGLEPGREYIYQYWVEGTLKVGDPFADKVVDPFNDQWIPDETYPGLIEYTNTDNGIATVLQTGQTPYSWSYPEPADGHIENEDLVIYELLVRDFLESHSYADLADTLNYLKRLGVNAIELMPVMEYEYNESWGYNPTYLFAPDKYYGTKDALKAFIDKAHELGMAVILDMVLNHQYGQSPMVMMYWDEVNNRPSAESPWFNVEPTHPFNVGYDFNHESSYTRTYVDQVNEYWLTEYNFDGYRFDLSKGFTQNHGKDPNDASAWSQYDQSRVDILTRMADHIWSVDPDAYVIFEHLGSNDEETVLANYGIMLWSNMNHSYNEVVNGNTGQDLNWALASSHGWTNKNLIPYMESHDEERLMVRALEYGAENGEYDIKDLSIALERIKLTSAFFYTLPGPKMLWQFGELGYDFPIDLNGRTGNKPIPWGDTDGLYYHLDEERVKLYKSKAAIINLVNEYTDVFEEGNFSWTPSGKMRKINITHDSMNITIVGNFGTSSGTMVPDFQHTGTWYDFFSGEAFTVTSTSSEVELAAGEFHVYLDEIVEFPEPGLVKKFTPVVTVEPGSFTADNRINLIFDASAANNGGTEGLVGASEVYMHAGVILTDAGGTTWENVVGNWGEDDGIGKMTPVQDEDDKWMISFIPRDYFGVEADQEIYRLAMVFRNAAGNNVGKGKDGSDIYINVSPDQDIIEVQPAMFTQTDTIRIIFNAAASDPAGTAGLIGESNVYMHSGAVLTDTETPGGGDWQNVVGNWGQDDGIGQMSSVAGELDTWEITMVPQDYYNLSGDQTLYYLAMVFRNTDGSAEGKGPGGSDIFIAVTEGAPLAADSLWASARSINVVELGWTDVANNELGYIVERSEYADDNFEIIAYLGENASSYTDATVVDGREYYYRVSATGSLYGDSEYSNVASALTPLAIPANLAATQVNLHSLNLSWQDNSVSEDGYIVERAIVLPRRTTNFVEIGSTMDNVNTLLDESVLPRLTFLYRVKATSVYGDSEYSDVLSAQLEVRPFSMSSYPTFVHSGEVTITVSGEIEAFKVTIINRFGEVQEILNFEGPGTYNLDVSDYGRGMYLIKATSPYYIQLRKFIIL
jgi:glycosidase